ncbi:hypothetical protein DPMN_137480 [Dreissena polymorpha]|uniref:Uncharacterized protein n=1 Tax=Dreissena polymorpha TaxID=45954 RepID=A0A9D4G7X1_DREPO|nr:hypothetical protein DPMN_137480 [Dreissena polymorpha]
MSFLGYHKPPYLYGNIGAVEGIAARQPAVIPDSQSWPSFDHPQANHDGLFARIVHLVDHYEDQLCCGMASQYCTSQRPKKGSVVTDPLTLLI